MSSTTHSMDLRAFAAVPDYVRNIALAIAAGLALGIGVGFRREQFDDRMSGPDEMESQIGAPMLGVVPRFQRATPATRAFLIGREQPKSPSAEAYRTVRTNTRDHDSPHAADVSPSELWS